MTAPAALRAWLGTLTAEDLQDLLERRPDVLQGAPLRDLDDLAGRLVHPTSVSRALARQPTPLAQVLETLLACGRGATARRAAELLDASDSGGDGAAHLGLVQHVVDELRRLALAWPGADDDGVDAVLGEAARLPDAPVEVNPGVGVVIPVPFGMARPLAAVIADIPTEPLKRIIRAWGAPVPTRKDAVGRAVENALGDPRTVRMILAKAPPAQAEVIVERIRRRAGISEPPRPADPQAQRLEQAALTWAREHGLAYLPYGGVGIWGLEIPSEVVLALLPPGAALPFTPVPPLLPTAVVTADQAHAAASGAITEALSVTMGLLEVIDREPAAGLKKGGIGTREVTRVAKAIGAQPTDVRLGLEVTAALGLLDVTAESRVTTSDRFRQWRRLEPADRAADLARGWQRLDLAPTIDRDAEGKPVPALGGDPSGRAEYLREAVLEHAREAGGVGFTSADALAEYLAWRLPFLAWRGVGEEIRATWAEGHRLGLLALGTLSEPGRALLAGDDDRLTATFREMLPATQSTALFGSDLTVIVPGSPAPAVVDLLDALAVREARGSAATWRITPESVRRALDDGYQAEDLLMRLRSLTPGEIPQPLVYLVRDVARRHGHVGVQASSAVVIGEDPGLVAEIAAHRGLRKVGLRQVAPTVLTSEARPDQVLAALRSAGYLPVPLDTDGVPVVAVRPRLADSGPEAEPEAEIDDEADRALRRWAAERNLARAEGPAEVAARLVRGDPGGSDPATAELEQTIAREARRLSPPEVRHLAHAITCHGSVEIQYRSSSSGVTVRVISDITLNAGYLAAWCHLRQDERWFALDGIQAVTPV